MDRQYVVGTRYEFHPINNESPYQDNACTATHDIAGGSVPGGPGPGGSGAGEWRWLAVVGVVVGGLAVAVAAVGMRRRAARRPSNNS